jgi:DNA-binding IclR family transcriptional regulator
MEISQKVIDALKYLEGKLQSSPSVAEIGKRAGVSAATAHKYLKQASQNGLIVQAENGKYMSLEVAEAYRKGK